MFTSCFGLGENKTRQKVRNLIEVTSRDCNGDDDNEPPVLMEIVSALGIESQWRDRVSPYCIVRLRKEAIHETKSIPHDPNPIWTVKTGAFCLLKIPRKVDDDDAPHDEHSVANNQVDDEKHSDEIDAVIVEVCHSNHCLGVVAVPFLDILQAKGERKEYSIRTKVDSGSNSSKGDDIKVGFEPMHLVDITGLTFILTFHAFIFLVGNLGTTISSSNSRRSYVSPKPVRVQW